MATRARVSAAKKKKAAHADRSAKSSNAGAKSVRRPADALKDIPVNAYRKTVKEELADPPGSRYDLQRDRALDDGATLLITPPTWLRW